LAELYSCIRFIFPQFSINYEKFKKIYIDPINAALSRGCKPEQKIEAEYKSKALNEIVSCMMLRRTETVLQKFLPKRNEFYVYLRPTIPEIIIYNKAIQTASDLYRNKKTDKNMETLAVYSALRKLINHPCLISTS
jgi:DNA repair and recombination protein RAD54B